MTTFSESYLKGCEYLESNIKKCPKDEFMCECKPCKNLYGKGSIQFGGLKKHVKTPKHRKTAETQKDKEGLSGAITFLENKKASQSVQVEEEATEEAKSPMQFEEDGRGSPEKAEHKEEKEEVEILEQKGLDYFRFQVASFLIKNNLPFSVTQNLMKFVKSIIKTHSSKSLSSYRMNRKHVGIISTHCIGPHFKEQYLDLLTRTPYSISMDEGKTKTNVQYLAINARFIPNENGTKTVTKLLGLVEIKESQTGETIYKMLEDFLFSGEGGLLRKKKYYRCSYRSC